MLYDLVHCPHRVHRDLFADPAERDAVNPFVELLWEHGNRFERQIIDALKVPFLDLSAFALEEKERRTRQAMEDGVPLIYGGRIRADDLLGDPDLLRREDGGYVPGDVKSGAAGEGGELRRLKRHYAVQLALYADILERQGRAAGRRGFIWDAHGKEVLFDLQARTARERTFWEDYQACLGQARGIATRSATSLPAYASACKQCHWYTACIRQLQEADDLTLIPELGRATRDRMRRIVPTIHAFSAIDPRCFIEGDRTAFPRLGPETLRRFHRRAVLLADPAAGPYALEPIEFPRAGRELFFDVETDPMRDLCYLHGFVERTGGDDASERYVPFFVDQPTEEAERDAFAEALKYIRESRPCTIYYYSKYERTYWRRLQQKHPEVCDGRAIEELFDERHAVDLYTDAVRTRTEWPVRDYSIKTLARFLGFKWRDRHPSGAASIEWYHRWVEQGDPDVRQRILEYNEDDCRAMRVLLEAIKALPLKSQ